jgi:hypothetical protein
MNMVMRSTVNNVANEMQITWVQESGVDLEEISSHADFRPSHVPYQGRIYSIGGKHLKYPPLSETDMERSRELAGSTVGMFFIHLLKV